MVAERLLAFHCLAKALRGRGERGRQVVELGDTGKWRSYGEVAVAEPGGVVAHEPTRASEPVGEDDRERGGGEHDERAEDGHEQPGEAGPVLGWVGRRLGTNDGRDVFVHGNRNGGDEAVVDLQVAGHVGERLAHRTIADRRPEAGELGSPQVVQAYHHARGGTRHVDRVGVRREVGGYVASGNCRLALQVGAGVDDVEPMDDVGERRATRPTSTSRA